MTPKISRATDPDFVGTEAALRRAAHRAREIAGRTGTPIVIWRDGRVVREYVRSAREEDPDPEGKSSLDGAGT